MMPLGLLTPGEHGEIVAIKTQLPEAAHAHGGPCCGNCRKEKEDLRVEDMGLRVGKVVEMLNSICGGPILLKVDESRIAIARSVAMKIMVRRQQ